MHIKFIVSITKIYLNRKKLGWQTSIIFTIWLCSFFVWTWTQFWIWPIVSDSVKLLNISILIRVLIILILISLILRRSPNVNSLKITIIYGFMKDRDGTFYGDISFCSEEYRNRTQRENSNSRKIENFDFLNINTIFSSFWRYILSINSIFHGFMSKSKVKAKKLTFLTK